MKDDKRFPVSRDPVQGPTVSLQLELMVEYFPEGVSKEDLAMYLANIANHAIEEGLLTGDTTAEVGNYWIHVKDCETGEYI